MKIKSSNIACFRYGWIQEFQLYLLSPHLSDLSFPPSWLHAQASSPCGGTCTASHTIGMMVTRSHYGRKSPQMESDLAWLGPLVNSE